MASPPVFPSFDGLLTLARRDGVDIRPTLLRVLTDLYVQTPAHSAEEERQFVELATRLIDEVDDATRAAARARLAVYPAAPRAILARLGLAPMPAEAPSPSITASPDQRADAPSAAPAVEAAPPRRYSAYSPEAHSINDIFLTADATQRRRILDEIDACPIAPAPRIDPRRAEPALERMERAALAADRAAFSADLSASLIVSTLQADCIVEDNGGELLAVACRALGMPLPAFQRVLLFLNPVIGHSVERVQALSRLYEDLSEHTALIMLAIWRGAMVHMTRSRHRPLLYDDETRHVRATAAPRAAARTPLTAPAARPAGARD
ncbi:MAG: DUF2336 domain-containing protein [Xanthobacteraceae bacterium]|nr:MAG: DUF2336 domain-containing protein [Xanthobacteraceae bacterium]